MSSSSTVFPLHLASTEGEVRKRGETAPRHQVILLPIALWLRTQSPNCRELYLFYSLSLIRVAILSHLPFEVLFPCVANSSNDLIDSGLDGREGRGGECWDVDSLTGSFSCHSFCALSNRGKQLVILTSHLLRIVNPVLMCRHLYTFYQNKQETFS